MGCAIVAPPINFFPPIGVDCGGLFDGQSCAKCRQDGVILAILGWQDLARVAKGSIGSWWMMSSWRG